jgi:hypothetical protein
VFSVSFPQDDETKELLSRMTPLSDEETETINDRLDLPQEVKGQTVPSQAVPSQAASVAQKSGADLDSELDRLAIALS